MRSIIMAILMGALATVLGCASSPLARQAPSAGARSTAPQYCISDGAAVTRTCELGDQKMLSAALADVPAATKAGGTVVLVRRGPEGMTREVIPLSAAGRLADPASDRVLRDGDQIVVPTREPSPVGLNRPMAARGVMN